MTAELRRAFWRTVRTFPSRTAAERWARSARWSPTVLERGLAVRVQPIGGAWEVQLGANDARLLRTRAD